VLAVAEVSLCRRLRLQHSGQQALLGCLATSAQALMDFQMLLLDELIAKVN